MSTEFGTAGDSNGTDSVFSAQDDDIRILFKWGSVVAAVVVFTCFVTTSLLKVVGLISASWLWVVAAAGISSVITGTVVVLSVVFFAAAFVNSIMSIG